MTTDTTTTSTLLRSVAERVVPAIRRRPVTAVVTVLVLLSSVIGVVLRIAAHHALGAAHHASVPVPLRAFAVTSGSVALLATVVGVVVLVGASERLMGSWRTVVAFVVTTVVGTGVAALAALVDTDGAAAGPRVLGRATALDPWTAVVGTILTASAFAGPLWRRRIRVDAIAVVAALLLYAGHAEDLAAAVAAMTGWALGTALRRAPHRSGWARSSHRETRVLLGTAVLVSAVGPVIAIVSRARIGLLAPLAAVVADDAGAPRTGCRIGGVTEACVRGVFDAHLADPFALVLVIAPLTVLLVGGLGLLHGNRFALWLVVAVDTVTAVAAATTFGLVPGRVAVAHGAAADDQLLITLSILASVLVPLGTAVTLVVLRHAFPIRPSRRRLTAFAVWTLASAAVLAVVVAVVSLTSPVRVDDPLRLVLAVLSPITPTSFWGRIPAIDPVLHTIVLTAGPVLWFVVAGAAVRPTGAAEPGTDVDRAHADRDRARALLVAGGGDAFGWMTTWPGNEHWFAEDGRAGVAFRRTGRVAVTVGGPFGYPDARASAMVAFARWCDDNGWTAAFHGLGADLAAELQRLGWRTLPVAEDADFDPRPWTTSGKKKQDVRTSVNRARREGTTATWAAWDDLPTATTRQIEAISEAWVAERDLPEMGFTLGGVDEMRDPAVRVLVAEDVHGRVLAVTSWLPSHRDGQVVGYTLDVMRRSSDAPNGVMEFLVASAAEQMRADDVERLSLSAAPLARSAPSGGNSQPADLLDLVGGVLEPVYGFRSLLRFKLKFAPDLHPLVLAYPDPVALPAIGVAVVRAYLPDLSLRQAASFARPRPRAAARGDA